MDYSKLLTDVRKISFNAGKILLKYQKNLDELYFKDKGASNIVSQADLDSDNFITKQLNKFYPEIKIYSEESKFSNNEQKSEYMFVIDPLDGSNYFSMDLPLYSVVISLLKNGKPVFTSVYIPAMGKHIYAIKGKGVFVNGKKINRVEFSNKQGKMIVAENNGYDVVRESIGLIRNLTGNVKRIITNWAPSIDYALIAGKKIDAIVSMNTEVEDSVGGFLICKELGYIIKRFDGSDYEPNFKNGFEYTLDKFIVAPTLADFEFIQRLLKG